jgi:hypothetical protein
VLEVYLGKPREVAAGGREAAPEGREAAPDETAHAAR